MEWNGGMDWNGMDWKLSEAMWTARPSGSGFSVSLFWPSSCKVKPLKSSKKKRRRRKRSKAIETELVDEATSTSNSVHPSVPKESELHLVTPNRALLKLVNTVSEPAIDINVDTSVSVQFAPCM